MKFAILADIHGNCLALEAVLDDMNKLGVVEAVNLGDHLSGPLEAKRTADLLIECNFPSICGNHDRWLIEQCPDEMGASDRAAFDQLEQKHIEWLRTLPSTLIYNDEVFLCHGTPSNDMQYWLEEVTQDAIVRMRPIEDIEQQAVGVTSSLILCGHTHIPRSVRLRDGRLIVNPGSVGSPGYDDHEPIEHIMQAGNPNAAYAIVEKATQGWDVTFRQIPYDHMAMSKLAKERGRAKWASALETGWVR